jgi:hypothetical protein
LVQRNQLQNYKALASNTKAHAEPASNEGTYSAQASASKTKSRRPAAAPKQNKASLNDTKAHA